MSTVRITPTLAVLPDGTALAAGGATSAYADIYNATTNTWSTTSPMTVARNYQAGTQLADGRVLVVGGQDPSGNTLASAEIYDPTTQLWAATGSMSTPRYLHSASLLPNGQVLVVGGWASPCCSSPQYALTSSELWNPATGEWTLTDSMASPHANHTAIALSNGDVLIAGGESYGQGAGPAATANAELYNWSTGTWTSLPAMSTPRDYAAAALMSSGQVLVAGGSPGGCCGGLTTAEVFDPATLTWTAAASMTTSRKGIPASTILNGNQVLVSGGYSCCSDPTPTRSSSEYYDLTTQVWHLTGTLNVARSSHSSITLPDGTVLTVGGYDAFSAALSSAERYFPDTTSPSLDRVAR